MYIIERYIIRHHIGPFFFSLAILTFIFVMDFILRYIDPFLKKGIGLQVILKVFALSLGHMFALIIPMAVLPATIMAFGTLTSENEITAMKANGISLYRMVLPGLLFASFLTAGMIVYNNHLLPESNHKLRNLLIDIYRKKPSIRIKPNTFIDAFKGYTIYVRKKDDKTGRIKDIQIFKKLEPGELPTTIVAKRGKLQYLEKQHVLRFELEDGEIHEMPDGTDPSTYRKTTFKTYIMTIEDVDRSLKHSDRQYRGDREMSVKQMNEKIEKIRDDIRMIDTKMVHGADTQVRGVLKLLDPEERERYFERERAKLKPRPPAGAGAEDVRVRSSIKVTGAPENFRMPKRGRKEYITFKALASQKEIKESYFRQINRYKVEIHKKFSIPFACIVFVLLGAPLAIRTGRSGMNTAVGISILFFLVYYVSLIGGEKLADRRIISPWLAMWGANILCGGIGVLLIRQTTREQRLIRWYKLNPLRLLYRQDAHANS
jgi:lipopolysaccharide export system permease protein